MKGVLKLVSFLVVLAVAGCSSSKKVETTEDSLAGNNMTAGALNLNGDSDNNTAGGISTIYFDFNSANLTQESKATLTSNGEFLKANPTVAVQIEGHCDERGGVQYNLALSEKRSKSVKDFLKALGISDKRMTAIGYGKEKPVDLSQTESAWAKNRRANFVITAK